MDNEKELDNAISRLGKIISEGEVGAHIANLDKDVQVQEVFRIMKRIVSGEDIRIECELHEPFVSSGAVMIVGKEVEVSDPTAFAQAAALATNFEVYPKVDGKIQMNFSFDGLTRKVM